MSKSNALAAQPATSWAPPPGAPGEKTHGRVQRSAETGVCVAEFLGGWRHPLVVVAPPALRLPRRPALHGPVHLLLVLVHRRGPIEAHLHGVALHLREDLLAVVEGVQRRVQRVLHATVVEAAAEQEARRLLDVRVVPQALHGVLEAPRLVHHGERAIHLRVHLREAARLELGGHQEEVATSHHPPLHARVEADVAADAPLEPALRLGHLLREGGLALAHDDELAAVRLPVHHPIDAGADQREALLVAQPPAETDQARIGVDLQAQLLLQGGLADALALGDVRESVVPRDLGVRGGAPLVRDAVQDAREPQLVAAPLEDLVQAVATLGRADLVGVVRRHGEHPVGRADAAREEVDAVGPQVHVLALQVVARRLRLQPEVGVHRKSLLAVLPLVRDVVDDHPAPGVHVRVVQLVLVEQVHREDARLPIVADEEHVLAVGRAVDLQHQRGLGRRQREERKPEEVVGVLGARRTIDALRPAEAWVVDEDIVTDLAVAVHLAVQEVPHIMPAAGEVEAFAPDAHALGIVVVHRRNRHRAVASQGELVAIGARDHGEAAGLGPRVHLGGDDDDGRAEMLRAVAHRPVLELGGLVLHLCAQGRHLVRVVHELVEGGEAREALHRRTLQHAHGARDVHQVRLRGHGLLLGRGLGALRRRRQVVRVRGRRRGSLLAGLGRRHLHEAGAGHPEGLVALLPSASLGSEAPVLAILPSEALAVGAAVDDVLILHAARCRRDLERRAPHGIRGLVSAHLQAGDGVPIAERVVPADDDDTLAGRGFRNAEAEGDVAR
mmetsp:Transcript_85675/g.239892  ORF Transcript_85675/g.239892 Transcript_85675/m.239892 type:complete len:784 (-) Transcript_85675:90-2441(-)